MSLILARGINQVVVIDHRHAAILESWTVDLRPAASLSYRGKSFTLPLRSPVIINETPKVVVTYMSTAQHGTQLRLAFEANKEVAINREEVELKHHSDSPYTQAYNTERKALRRQRAPVTYWVPTV